ncbi:MAG TPA: tetratricopeptide repeat protein [Azonexus sp.]|nr:tetratricopeptide repeat protein [Azonexus sp.]
MKKTVVALMLAASVGISMPSIAAEPALHEVYQAANSGKMDDAQRMMKEVLQAHPNSGKAHYVEAELLAKQGNLKQAADQLATAEKLAPGLPFATPQAVSSLRETISRHSTGSVAPAPAKVQRAPFAAQPAHEESGFPWGMLFIGLGLIAFIVWASKLMSRRNAPAGAGPSQPGYGGYQPAYPAGPYGGSPQGYGAPGAAPAAGSGLGSQMLGGLATGAAVGAGVVAGEALLHHFMDGNKATPTTDRAFSNYDSIPDLPSTPLNDMGGNDFGVSDNSSWDDGGLGDSDWN